MKQTLKIMLTLGLGLLLLPLSASAQKMHRIAKRLNLSPAQQSKIRQITYQGRRSTIMLKANLQIAQLDLRNELAKNRPDTKKVMAGIEKVGKLRIEMRKKRTMVQLRIRKVLSVAQWKQWRVIQRNRWKRRWKKRRWRRGRRHRRWRRGRRHHQPHHPQPAPAPQPAPGK